MPRTENAVRAATLRISTTPQILALLRQIAKTGLYGRNPAEVASRLIEEQAREMVLDDRMRKLIAMTTAPGAKETE